MLTQEQTEQIINDAMEEIKAGVVSEATKNVAWTAKRAIEINVNEIVETFIRDEVQPELLVSLEAKKSTIIEAALLGAEEMAVMLSKAMASALAENLTTTYKRDQIIKAMFD